MVRALSALILALGLVLAGCGPAARPTASPPTPTQAATPQPPPTHTPQPISATTAPIGTPLLSPTEGGPGPIVEAIVIAEPKVAAGVVSSVHIEGEADPTFEQSLSIHILDAEGNVVGQGAAQIEADTGQRGRYRADVPFRVDSEQPGRIIIYSVSARDGNITHLNSVEVRLKPSGEATPGIADSGSPLEAIIIHSPAPGASLTPTVTITGEAAPTFEQHLNAMIQDEMGNVIATGSTIIQADAGQRGPFSFTLTYRITAAGPGRIVVYDTSPRDGGIVHLASVEVRLTP